MQIKIVFVHSNKAFLPGIPVYSDFFSRYGISCESVSGSGWQHMKRDVEWLFMGTDRHPRNPGILRIHEYASASLPPFSRQKDWLKKVFNQRPDYRVFQNEYVKDQYRFQDGIPSGFREPCLTPDWLVPELASAKKYDFIYTGSVHRKRRLEQLLDHFCGPLSNHGLLILGKDYGRLQKQYAPAKNIRFEGPLPYVQVRQKILASRFAINFIPDQLPFSRQVSTKLLEYAACRIPIITTDYEWIRGFEKASGGTYFYLSGDLQNFTWAAVNAFPYQFPDLANYTGEAQIRRSGILPFLQQRFPGLSFD